MIYTVGRRDVYLQNWHDNGEMLHKLGRTDNYPGGSVWRTYEEAQRVADHNPGFAVFGVDADWEADTALSDDSDASFRDLLHDAAIIILESLA